MNPYWIIIKTHQTQITWWRHQMETFSALLALCAGNSPVPVNSRHKGQWRGALMFSLICARINDWVNNREAGDLRRHRGHYDVSVMTWNNLIMQFITVASHECHGVWTQWYLDHLFNSFFRPSTKNISKPALPTPWEGNPLATGAICTSICFIHFHPRNWIWKCIWEIAAILFRRYCILVFFVMPIQSWFTKRHIGLFSVIAGTT